MLRHYDEIGLLNPIQTDPGTGYRYYGEEQLYVINKITSLKDMGVGLTEIREILDSREDSAMLEKRLHLKQTELQKTAGLTTYRLQLLDTAI